MVGNVVGRAVGRTVGSAVGNDVGTIVGDCDGAFVPSSHCVLPGYGCRFPTLHEEQLADPGWFAYVSTAQGAQA